jgi:ribosomal RNA-processing protein 7
MTSTASSSLSSYTILQVSFPPQPAYPKSATHYIYLRPDAPKAPSPDTPRSLFLANIPIDSSEESLRALFKQIGGALVDRVEFEEDEGKSSTVLVKGQKWGKEQAAQSSNRKRKRDEGLDEDKEKLALPATWEFKLRRSGSSAVVVFVDRATAEAVLKECVRMAKRKEKVEWRSTEELGEKRKADGILI